MTKIAMDEKWFEILSPEFQKNYMKNLRSFLLQEVKAGYTIFPPKDLVFNAFLQTPFEKVKAVIVGQDPYHGSGQAHGLCFSVRSGVALPPSLKNIFKELVDDVHIRFPTSGDLTPWAKQGVLLLNATLTVRAGEPLSHFGKGWETFTDFAIEALGKKNDPIVFLLWGKSAQDKCFNVFHKLKDHNHLVLTAAHPSFYSVSGFWGCKHFSKTNEFLRQNKKEIIDWQI